jgi:hypothetical protein
MLTTWIESQRNLNEKSNIDLALSGFEFKGI